METELRQPILLSIAVLIPLILLLRKQPRLLVGWVCFTLFVQVFDTVSLTNLPASRVTGLLYLPLAAFHLRDWSRLTPVRAWLLNFGALLLLGLLFGFLWPWPDMTMMRPFMLTAPGRTIVYLVRLLSDMSLMVLFAQVFRQPGTLLLAGRALVLAATISALAGLIYFVTQVDLYFLLTGLGEEILSRGRARGLTIEPRALGLVCAYGLMLLLIGRRLLFRLWPVLLAVNLAGLLVTYSVSSMVMFLAGLATAWTFFSNRIRLIVLITAAIAAGMIGSAYLFLPQEFEQAVLTIQSRVDPDFKLMGIPPGSFGQEIAYRLDVFDACAMLFLLDQPEYALLGTGPGLVSLPASNYVPPGLYSMIWTPDVGINSLPSHGLLHEICNSGLVGLLLWGWQVLSCGTALLAVRRFSSDRDDSQVWTLGYAIFLVGVVFYVVQMSHTPVWSMILGIGWAAVARSKECQQAPAQLSVEDAADSELSEQEGLITY